MFTGTVVVVACWRGDGVSGIRPPAVRDEKSPLWDLTGVDIAAVDIMKINEEFFFWVFLCREVYRRRTGRIVEDFNAEDVGSVESKPSIGVNETNSKTL